MADDLLPVVLLKRIDQGFHLLDMITGRHEDRILGLYDHVIFNPTAVTNRPEA